MQKGLGFIAVACSGFIDLQINMKDWGLLQNFLGHLRKKEVF